MLKIWSRRRLRVSRLIEPEPTARADDELQRARVCRALRDALDELAVFEVLSTGASGGGSRGVQAPGPCSSGPRPPWVFLATQGKAITCRTQLSSSLAPWSAQPR